MNVEYSIGDAGERYSANTTWEMEEAALEYIAQDCAEDYHSNHDGWEDKWPLVVHLYSTEGLRIGSFIVKLEMEPSFYARPM